MNRQLLHLDVLAGEESAILALVRATLINAGYPVERSYHTLTVGPKGTPKAIPCAQCIWPQIVEEQK